jgi:hypothetical protein
MKKYLIIPFLIIVKTSFAQKCNCDSIFLQSKQIVEENYAGWYDKVNSKNLKEYDNWTSKQYLMSKEITNDSVCAKQLQNWISFFKDKHLRVRYSKPKLSVNSTIENKNIEILSTGLTENQLTDYFKKTKNLDPIEGFYENSNYKLAVTQVKPNLFYATINKTQNENWKPGEVKLAIKKINKKYIGTFYEGDKSDISEHNVQLVDNILDFDIVFFEKTFPIVETKRDLTEYEMSKDKYAPSLNFYENVAIWKFPSFENNAYEQTEYLLNKYKDKLESTPYWVLDLSNNSGGDYSIGLQMLDYIYTKPILNYNSEMRMTKSNFEKWYQFIAEYYENADAKTKKALDERMGKMKAHYGELYNESGTQTDTLRLDKVKINPKKIALLINENTVSSGELFTILARQSDKVIVLGTNSGGMMDYGNVVTYKTNFSTIKIQLPTNRQLWLDTNFSVDKEGLKPDTYLKGNNWIEQAIKLIKE